MKSIQSNEMKRMLSKVPEVTIYFWIIKILCTTVGETAADFLNVNLNFGLTGTSIVTGVFLLVAMYVQFKSKQYIPSIYWLTVFLISIFGTLVTDNLTDNLGIPLEVSTIVFSAGLVSTFILWYANEKTLSIHSIFTKRREAFYWLTILFTFALGTAAGDLMAESLGLGYVVTGAIVCAVIAIMTASWRLGLDAVLAFWIAYIMTRPLGASIGDFLSQTQDNGGLGLGATVTSVIFIAAILLLVIFLSVTKRDLIPTIPTSAKTATEPKRFSVKWQVIVVVAVLVLAAGTGYYMRHSSLQDALPSGSSSSSSTQAFPQDDISNFMRITEDTLSLVQAGNPSAAKTRVSDLETAWDKAAARLKSINKTKWSKVDNAIDKVLRQVRAVHPDATAGKASLEALISVLN
ncbi:hypothetical protein GCM10008018_17550 [Paenibacillus marchantiophytorum]|uniref:Membrane-anchored protein n=1 Tax=Paenibacillus marchantiophytorum TaxID=1619310 RepID=A0ABQ2BSF3_9BACL|nr:hypothetical protein [Paenibacillus marchantiophytorum]GGI46529.1 hypothetical protein GCM10008018_17550 [Paenibacillus marchantiophytorum]